MRVERRHGVAALYVSDMGTVPKRGLYCRLSGGISSVLKGHLTGLIFLAENRHGGKTGAVVLALEF